MLKKEAESKIPTETVKAAQAVFPHGNMYLTLNTMTLSKLFEELEVEQGDSFE